MSVFLEISGPGDHLALRIENGAGAIEKDMIVAAHLIDKDYR